MIFCLEENRPSDSPFVHSIWRVQSQRSASFISTASIHWEMVLMRRQGKTSIVVRGPETQATYADVPADAEWLGITFKLGVFMPHLPPASVLDRHDADLPAATSRSFWLHDSAWEYPTYENADTFVRRLECTGMLKHDTVVDAALECHPQALSRRSIQYRFVRATGLTQSTIQQIQRANRAAALLAGGMSILDTVHETGYFDQSHLTQGLKRFLGQTPAQISRVSAAV